MHVYVFVEIFQPKTFEVRHVSCLREPSLKAKEVLALNHKLHIRFYNPETFSPAKPQLKLQSNSNP